MALYTSLAVFLFSALALVVPSGFSLGATLLVLGSLALPWTQVQPRLTRDDYRLIGILALYFIVCTSINWAHDAPLREYDAPLRFLLAIPALLLLLAYPPKAGAFWGGLAAGAIAGGILAAWQNLGTGNFRAGGYTNPIQFGNISLLAGMLCLAGLGWGWTQRRSIAWTIFIASGAVMGTLGSLFTGSRGGWVSLPLCLFVLYRYYGGAVRKRYIAASWTILIAAFAVLYAVPRTEIQARVQTAATETRDYLSTGNANSSVGARLEMWRMGLLIAPERPWLGWGKEGYMERAAQLVKAGTVHPIVGAHNHLHNEYFDALVKRGIPGLAAVLILYLAPLFLFAKRQRQAEAAIKPYALAGMLVMVSYLGFGFTQAFLTHNNGVMILAFMLVILWALSRQNQRSG